MKQLTQKDYKQAMKIIEMYFDSEPTTLEGVIIQCLAMLAEKYETEQRLIKAYQDTQPI